MTKQATTLFVAISLVLGSFTVGAMERSTNSDRERRTSEPPPEPPLVAQSNDRKATASPDMSVAATGSNRTEEEAPARTPNRIYVKYRESAPDLTSFVGTQMAQQFGRRAGVTLQHTATPTANAQILTVGEPKSEQELKAIAEQIERENADVEYAEPERIMQIQQSNDPRYSEQWHYYLNGTGINLPAAWSRATGRDVVVAVIDTGIRPHQDLRDRLLPGYDFVTDLRMSNDGDGRDADATDPGDWCPQDFEPLSSWHGTHVAGTIAAITDNKIGVAGVARDANIVPVRALGQCGGSSIDIVQAILWSAGLPVSGVPRNANPAKVINMSLGGPRACGRDYADAIRQVRELGVTVVVAAGNSDSDAADFEPASCEGVISVAATNRQGARADFGGRGRGSNYGRVVKISAPGGENHKISEYGILSTLNAGTDPGEDSYGFYQGTSMAAPHVAGIAALLYQAKPSISPDEVLSVLQYTSQAFPKVRTRQCETRLCGAGIADGAAALEYVLEERAARATTSP